MTRERGTRKAGAGAAAAALILLLGGFWLAREYERRASWENLHLFLTAFAGFQKAHYDERAYYETDLHKLFEPIGKPPKSSEHWSLAAPRPCQKDAPDTNAVFGGNPALQEIVQKIRAKATECAPAQPRKVNVLLAFQGRDDTFRYMWLPPEEFLHFQSWEDLERKSLSFQ